MRGPLASVAVFALACGWTVGARAQSSPVPPSAPSGQTPAAPSGQTPAAIQGPPPLNVNRGADAQDCPDAVRLAGDIEAIRGPRTAAATTGYSVAFARSGQTFSATIRSGPEGASVRLIEARGQTCAALAHAVAVTLSLLFDSDKVETAGTRPDEVKPPTPEPAIIEPSPPVSTAADHKPRREATLAVGAAGLVGVLRPLSPGLTGELGLEIGRWRTGLGALWGAPQTLDLGAGTVHESLLAGSMRACYAPWRGDRLRFDLCTGAFIGVVRAEGRGYSTNVARTQPWLAAPLEAAVAVFTGPLGLELGAGGLASFQRPDFSVDGIGVAYRSPLVGATVSLRAIAQVPW